jgi:hypothetical protein
MVCGVSVDLSVSSAIVNPLIFTVWVAEEAKFKLDVRRITEMATNMRRVFVF